jgi:hypothetical protein
MVPSVTACAAQLRNRKRLMMVKTVQNILPFNGHHVTYESKHAFDDVLADLRSR